MGASFLCASGEAHWIVTVDPIVRDPLLTLVEEVRLIVHVSVPLTNVICVSVSAVTFPVIWTACPNAALLKMHPAAITPTKIFGFIRTLNAVAVWRCKLFVGPSLTLSSAARQDSPDSYETRSDKSVLIPIL